MSLIRKGSLGSAGAAPSAAAIWSGLRRAAPWRPALPELVEAQLGLRKVEAVLEGSIGVPLSGIPSYNIPTAEQAHVAKNGLEKAG